MPIERKLFSEASRVQIASALFGRHFDLQLETTVYQFAGMRSSGYHGGYLEFYTLNNGGFNMALHSEQSFSVACENGFEGMMSAEALGITARLYAYSHLSFSDDEHLRVLYARHYHLLRDYLHEHPDAKDIYRAID